MILVDTSVWVDHLRSGDRVLARLLDDSHVLAHPWLIGELALGRLRNRREIIDLLENLPSATLATPATASGSSTSWSETFRTACT